MDEFIRENYSFLTKLVEIIAAITGLVYYKKYKNTSVKYFIWFLIYVALIELIGGYTMYLYKYEFLNDIEQALKGTKFEKNYWWGTLSWQIIAILFFAFYYHKIINSKSISNLIKILSFSFLLSSIIYIAIYWEAFFIQNLIFIDLFGSAIIVICVISYLLEVLKSEEILIFYKSIDFYITAIILIWWLIITPISFYDIYFSTADWNFIILRQHLYLFANIFMYLSFAFALMWCKPRTN